MASSREWMAIEDPEYFHLLTTDLKERMIKAGIQMVNTQAALTRKNAIKTVQSDFTLRNNFTARQIQYEPMEKSRLISLSLIQSRIGVTEKADYMARQETGGARQNNSGRNLAIPKVLARGGSMLSPVQKKHYLSRLKRVRQGERPSGFNRSWLVRKAYVAHKNNLVMRYAASLVTVTNFTKKGDNVSFKMNRLYSIGHEETFTPASPWLKPSSKQPAKDGEKIFTSAMKKSQ